MRFLALCLSLIVSSAYAQTHQGGLHFLPEVNQNPASDSIIPSKQFIRTEAQYNRSTVTDNATLPRAIDFFTERLENLHPLQSKYALLLDVELESVPLSSVLNIMEDWWGTPYRLGGNSKSGIDCSAFTGVLYQHLFGLQLPRTSREQFDCSEFLSSEQLKEGDLVFFGSKKHISHVGMYLRNGKFVHASTSMGVVISDLEEPYWRTKYRGGGRPIVKAEPSGAIISE